MFSKDDLKKIPSLGRRYMKLQEQLRKTELAIEEMESMLRGQQGAKTGITDPALDYVIRASHDFFSFAHTASAVEILARRVQNVGEFLTAGHEHKGESALLWRSRKPEQRREDYNYWMEDDLVAVCTIPRNGFEFSMNSFCVGMTEKEEWIFPDHERAGKIICWYDFGLEYRSNKLEIGLILNAKRGMFDSFTWDTEEHHWNLFIGDKDIEQLRLAAFFHFFSKDSKKKKKTILPRFQDIDDALTELRSTETHEDKYIRYVSLHPKKKRRRKK